MNKSELVNSISEKCNVPKKAVNAILDSFAEVVSTKVMEDGEKVSLTGLGIFKQLSKDARMARNPKTGERVFVPAKKILSFKMTKKS